MTIAIAVSLVAIAAVAVIAVLGWLMDKSGEP